MTTGHPEETKRKICSTASYRMAIQKSNINIQKQKSMKRLFQSRSNIKIKLSCH